MKHFSLRKFFPQFLRTLVDELLLYILVVDFLNFLDPNEI